MGRNYHYLKQQLKSVQGKKPSLFKTAVEISSWEETISIWNSSWNRFMGRNITIWNSSWNQFMGRDHYLKQPLKSVHAKRPSLFKTAVEISSWEETITIWNSSWNQFMGRNHHYLKQQLKSVHGKKPSLFETAVEISSWEETITSIWNSNHFGVDR